MEQSPQISSSTSLIQEGMPKNKIVIGYYNLRGKAQVCRLLAEYLEVQYEDKLFTLAEWQKFNANRTREWSFSCLPFLREGSFVVTESVSMCVYLINRFGSPDLLGKTLADQGIVEMYLWNIQYMGNVITINCQQKSEEQLRIFKQKQWEQKVHPRLKKIEQAVVGQWFLGYTTIIDFSIYELIRYMDCIFINKTNSFPKLKKIQSLIADLPAIKKYEQSPRAIIEWCPTKLLQSLPSPNRAANQ